VASPFAGTKYLQDSDDENDVAVTSRTNSQDDNYDSDLDAPGPLFHQNRSVEIKRVDKPKPQQGGGVSWRAFSEGRADQRTAEIALLQANLRKRRKSISFGSHAVTDDGEHIPLIVSTDHPSGPNTRGPKGGKRGRSPPRRSSDTEPTADETADGFERYDPTQFKTNPFTGDPVRRSNSDPDAGPLAPLPDVKPDLKQSDSPHSSLPDIRIEDISS